jgi:Ca2+-binding EF-hand superfamily protein
VRLLLAALVFGTAPAMAADPVLAIPTGSGMARLQLELTVNGKAPEVAWAAFLDKLFDHFDRDADGILSAAESARVFPLPLAGGRVAKLDGQHDRTAFKSFYRDAGFTPVVALVEPAPADTLALGAALFRALDRDRNGKLSVAELRDAPALLRRLDEDEDEVLGAAELLAASQGGKVTAAGLKLVPPDDTKPNAALRVPVGGRPTLATSSDRFQLTGSRLTVPGGVCVLGELPVDSVATLPAAKAFYLAQFKGLVGDKPATKAVLEDDPTTQVLASLFDAADRDGDGKLTRAELEAFFDLIEAGVRCRVVVTAVDRGRNLFDRFDANGDGRLDLAELTRGPGTPLGPDAVPASYRLAVGLGSVGDSFGPVPLGSVAKPKPVAKAVIAGPRWFRAMDRNADGFVSANEFLGAPELFTRLDTDRDGRISPDEAVAGK